MNTLRPIVPPRPNKDRFGFTTVDLHAIEPKSDSDTEDKKEENKEEKKEEE